MRSEREDSAGASRFVPETGELGELSRAVQSCRGRDLYREATRTVFVSDPARAGLVQLGDVESRRGEQLVGPAGGLLRHALRDAGVDEADTYLTNAAEHVRRNAGPRGGKLRGSVLAWTLPGEHDDRPEEGRDEIRVVATVHPSAVLREPDHDEAFAAFVDDPRRASDLLARRGAPAKHQGGV